MQWSGDLNIGETDKCICCATCEHDIKKNCRKWTGTIDPQKCLHSKTLKPKTYRGWQVFNINLTYAYWKPIYPEKDEPLEKELFEI
jgi:hypothetical protein